MKHILNIILISSFACSLASIASADSSYTIYRYPMPATMSGTYEISLSSQFESPVIGDIPGFRSSPYPTDEKVCGALPNAYGTKKFTLVVPKTPISFRIGKGKKYGDIGAISTTDPYYGTLNGKRVALGIDFSATSRLRKVQGIYAVELPLINRQLLKAPNDYVCSIQMKLFIPAVKKLGTVPTEDCDYQSENCNYSIAGKTLPVVFKIKSCLPGSDNSDKEPTLACYYDPIQISIKKKKL